MRALVVLAIALPLIGCTSDDTAGPPSPDAGGVDTASPPDGYDATVADGSRDATAVDASTADANAHDASVADTNAPDTNAPDANVSDTSPADADAPDTTLTDADAADANVADRSAPDAGPLGSQTNPVASCKALLAAVPAAPSGAYYVTATGNAADAFASYCDMSTEGGGWTKVTAAVDEAQVRALLGSSGKQMMKCTDGGAAYFASPSFVAIAPPVLDAGVDAGSAVDGGVAAAVWTWAGTAFTQVGGTWRVSGADQACGTNPEYTNVVCPTWFGVGCGNGSGNNNKFFPGVLDTPAGFCADDTSGHTNASFSICGSNNFRTYSVFVRAD